jgi:SET domain-containing protein|tara:strand:- start:125 stop:559 length:435 start_codon:yes stop_codon:yes gene_type:complete
MGSLLQTYVRPGVSKIKGVGIIAIRNIPKGTFLGQTKKIAGRWKTIEWARTKNVDPVVIDLMQDYVCHYKHDISKHVFVPYEPFTEFQMQLLMNHSTDPNVTITNNNCIVSIKDIYKDEELTEDYLCVCGENYVANRINASKAS